ncbi:hypothetical protein [Devosia elaeis]|uniref:COG3904 family protein n=1 Tax=Devosia elaeis TaxID=1770058 RepID=UPI000A8BF09E|nr:hypothetical protein [Devosia elaeis]
MSSQADVRTAPDARPFLARLVSRLARIEDGAILRFAFFALLAGTISVLYVDFRALDANAPAALTHRPQPILPPASTPDGTGGARPAVTSSPDLLDAPLDIALEGGGVLRLTGTIDPGAADRFAAEIAARGEYVETILLDSPGGSVEDALAIGRLIGESGLKTRVADGGLCASSCPIVFASGTERQAGRAAAIGVHQIYAAALGADPVDALGVAGMAMANAQSMTAEITRHLGLSGVDPSLWLHALETPPDRLYYFTPEEMDDLRLVTQWVES